MILSILSFVEIVSTSASMSDPDDWSSVLLKSDNDIVECSCCGTWSREWTEFPHDTTVEHSVGPPLLESAGPLFGQGAAIPPWARILLAANQICFVDPTKQVCHALVQLWTNGASIGGIGTSLLPHRVGNNSLWKVARARCLANECPANNAPRDDEVCPCVTRRVATHWPRRHSAPRVAPGRPVERPWSSGKRVPFQL